jgi:hypothetical protein
MIVQTIELNRTFEGQAAQVQAQLENNAKDYMAILRGMSMADVA